MLWSDFSITSPIISPCPSRVIAVWSAVSVRGLIPDLERSDGSSPQASCHLSLVFPSFIVSQAPSSRWALNSFQSGKTFRHILNVILMLNTTYHYKKRQERYHNCFSTVLIKWIRKIINWKVEKTNRNDENINKKWLSFRSILE